MSIVDGTRINVLIPKRKSKFDSICISSTKIGKRCKNKRVEDKYCRTHLDKEESQCRANLHDDLASLGLDAEDLNVWGELHERYLDKYGTKTLKERAETLQKLLEDTPIDKENSKPFEWVPQSFHWVKCEQCTTHSLLEAGGCKTCKLFDRLIELPKNA